MAPVCEADGKLASSYDKKRLALQESVTAAVQISNIISAVLVDMSMIGLSFHSVMHLCRELPHII